MLQDKFHIFVARFTVPLVYLLETVRYTVSVCAATSKLPFRSAANADRLPLTPEKQLGYVPVRRVTPLSPASGKS